MKRSYCLGLLTSMALLAGCNAAPMAPAVPVDVLSAPDDAGYALLATTTPVAIAGLHASSAADTTWHGPSNVIDGVLTTAWAPAASDDAPSLWLDLGGLHALDGLTIKLSLGRTSSPTNQRVHVAVWRSCDCGETWDLLAADLNPHETTLERFGDGTTVAGLLRLDFTAPGANLHDLLVCHVGLTGPGSAPD